MDSFKKELRGLGFSRDGGSLFSTSGQRLASLTVSFRIGMNRGPSGTVLLGWCREMERSERLASPETARGARLRAGDPFWDSETSGLPPAPAYHHSILPLQAVEDDTPQRQFPPPLFNIYRLRFD